MRSASPLSLATLGALAALACVSDRPLAPANEPAAAGVEVGGPFAALESQAAPTTFVVVAKGNKWNDRVTADLRALGAEVTAFPELGLAIVTSTDPEFRTKAGNVSGVDAAVPDQTVRWIPPDVNVVSVELESSEPVAAPDAIFGSIETFRAVQWAPDAVSAPDAWDAGVRGAGARVAILDGGIHSTHIDIAPRIDLARSRSFVPNQPFNFDQRRDPATGVCGLTDTFWHGTHVAGIVAAPGNTLGTVGIAPDATIIGVKVLHCGSGSFGQVLQGIVYAATPIAEGGAGAHIINMSLGALIQQGGSDVAHLKNAIHEATRYAERRGVLVVASAGNEESDLDGGLLHLPSGAPHVMSISATGPVGWALGATNVDRPASYTNFGNSAISVAGPGGDFVLPGNQVCTLPRFPAGTVQQFCWALDMVMAPCRGSGAATGSYCWAAGTSMSAPAVSGVAALIVGKFGPMSPSDIRKRIEKSADDLGKPGNDEFYGRGRINALRAVQ